MVVTEVFTRQNRKIIEYNYTYNIFILYNTVDLLLFSMLYDNMCQYVFISNQ